MRVSTICRRIADELRDAGIANAGLKQAYYPAPNTISETPAALIFAGLGTGTPMLSEQVWEHEIRVQIMVASKGRTPAEINAVDALIEEIWDHFAPGSNAFHLRASGSDQMVHHCRPTRYEAGLLVDYAGALYSTVTIFFSVKTHRFPGAE